MAGQAMSEKGRKLAAAVLLLGALALIAVGARQTVQVYYARDLAPEGEKGITVESMQSIAGGSESRWGPDLSRQEYLGSTAMMEHSTTGGVARTEGILHLTGQDACPT